MTDSYVVPSTSLAFTPLEPCPGDLLGWGCGLPIGKGYPGRAGGAGDQYAIWIVGDCSPGDQVSSQLMSKEEGIHGLETAPSTPRERKWPTA